MRKRKASIRRKNLSPYLSGSFVRLRIPVISFSILSWAAARQSPLPPNSIVEPSVSNLTRRTFNSRLSALPKTAPDMKTGGKGGASTLTGLKFEKEVDFLELLVAIPEYTVRAIPGKAGMGVYFKGQLVARCFKKHAFYEFLKENRVDWRPIISKKLLPDDALLVIVRDTLFIIEVKYQQVAGSVDEKLQTCDFKRKQYLKLVTPLRLRVEYVYVLGDWFHAPAYKDVLDYIQSVHCNYYFGTLPLAWLGLPTG
jgi:hypothetical protein